MAEPLATAADVEDRLGRPLATEESRRIEALLTDSSAEIRSYTGQHLTRATTTVTVPVVGGRAVLLQRPIIEVTSVDTDTGALDGPHPVEGGTLAGLSGCSATVTYTHGYEQVPAEVVAIVCAMVLRNLATPTVGEVKSAEGIGEYNYRLAASAIARRPVIDGLDKATLDRYRLPDLGAIWVALP